MWNLKFSWNCVSGRHPWMTQKTGFFFCPNGSNKEGQVLKLLRSSPPPSFPTCKDSFCSTWMCVWCHVCGKICVATCVLTKKGGFFYISNGHYDKFKKKSFDLVLLFGVNWNEKLVFKWIIIKIKTNWIVWTPLYSLIVAYAQCSVILAISLDDILTLFK